jgi:uncharacterized membrane protein YccF (DUF307 family)
MSCLGNLIWILIGGIFTSLYWLLSGVLLSITIIGIPLGVQCFKFAKLSFAPYGKKVRLHFFEHPIANIIWVLTVGWIYFMGYVAIAVLYFITIIGISRGIQTLKFSILALAPFGAKVD